MRSASILSFLIFAILLVELDANAASKINRKSCDVLLSAVQLNSIDEGISLSQLSESGQTYVRLVNHYLKQAPGGDSGSLLAEIIASSQLVNPFANKTGSLAVQVSNAIKSIYSKITPQDWKEIRRVLKELNQQVQSEKKDRSSKKKQTVAVFNPKEIAQENLANLMESSPAGYTTGGRAFVTAVTRDGVSDIDGFLHLYELKNNKLKKLSETKVIGMINAKLSWFTHQGRTFFTYSPQGEAIRLYELIDDKPVLVDQVDLKMKLATDVLWRVVGDNIFLTFGAKNGLYLYELSDNKLNYLSLLSGMFSYPRPQWHSIEGREYISIFSLYSDSGEFINSTFLAEVKNKTLVLLDKKSVYKKTVSKLKVTHLFGQRRILSDAYYYDGLHIFEIVDGKIKELMTPHYNEPNESNGFNFKDGDLLALGSLNKLEMVELNGETLRPLSEAFGQRVATQSWHYVDTRHFVARANSEGLLVINELAEGKNLIEKAKFDYNRWNNQSWLQNGDETYLLVKVEDSIRVIKIFNSAGVK